MQKGGKTNLQNAYTIIKTLVNQSSEKNLGVSLFIKNVPEDFHENKNIFSHNLKHRSSNVNSKNFNLSEKRKIEIEEVSHHKNLNSIAQKEVLKLPTYNPKNLITNIKQTENTKDVSEQEVYKLKELCKNFDIENLNSTISLDDKNFPSFIKHLSKPKLEDLSNYTKNLEVNTFQPKNNFRKRKISSSTTTLMNDKNINLEDNWDISRENNYSQNIILENISNDKSLNIYSQENKIDSNSDNILSLSVTKKSCSFLENEFISKERKLLTIKDNFLWVRSNNYLIIIQIRVNLIFYLHII